MAFPLLTLFARREPTTDPVLQEYAPGTHHQDTVFYRDRDCTQRYARWSWFISGCPDRRSTRVVLNCYPWRIEWLG